MQGLAANIYNRDVSTPCHRRSVMRMRMSRTKKLLVQCRNLRRCSELCNAILVIQDDYFNKIDIVSFYCTYAPQFGDLLKVLFWTSCQFECQLNTALLLMSGSSAIIRMSYWTLYS